MIIKNKSYFSPMETKSIQIDWYIIFNPTSGGGNGQKKINHILFLLNKYTLDIK